MRKNIPRIFDKTSLSSVKFLNHPDDILPHRTAYPSLPSTQLLQALTATPHITHKRKSPLTHPSQHILSPTNHELQQRELFPTLRHKKTASTNVDAVSNYNSAIYYSALASSATLSAAGASAVAADFFERRVRVAFLATVLAICSL